jgi:hypothetical protein
MESHYLQKDSLLKVQRPDRVQSEFLLGGDVDFTLLFCLTGLESRRFNSFEDGVWL